MAAACREISLWYNFCVARKNENQIARGIDDLPDLSKIPIERLQEVEKRLQRKMRALLEAGVPLPVAAATSNHLLEDLLKEISREHGSGTDAPMH